MNVHRELQLQKGILQAEDDLVKWIEAALKESKYGKLEESQFRNLVRVSDTTESVEVIKNFLHYQVGRDIKWGRGKDSLAERIIHDIDDKIQKQARTIGGDTDYKKVHIELTRRYLGYGARYLTYKLKGETQETTETAKPQSQQNKQPQRPQR